VDGKEEWWNPRNYESGEAFIQALAEREKRQDDRLYKRRRPSVKPGGGWLPDADGNLTRRWGPMRQLGIRIGEEQYEALGEIARRYGMRPTTMARFLVLRGLEALREEGRADEGGAQEAEADSPTED
jgi:hypothetical protein